MNKKMVPSMSVAMITRYIAIKILALFSLAATALGSEFEETLKLARELPKKISSCELSYESSHAPNQTQFILLDDMKWYFSITTDGKSDPFTLSGFDGSQYWCKHQRQSTALFGSKPITVGRLPSHPLVANYWWLTDPTPKTLSQLQSDEAWDRLVPDFQYVSTDRINDNLCDQFRLKRGEKEFLIAFSKTLNGYPIRVEHHESGRLKIILTVVETWKSENGAVIGTKFMRTLPSGTTEPHLTVNKGSIQLNKKKDDFVFRFDAGDAATILNADQIKR